MPQATEATIPRLTPVKQGMRTATEDTVIRGVPIPNGASGYLS
ncbi:hypothetical protein LRC484719_18280 [Mycobacterium riyadhense]